MRSGLAYPYWLQGLFYIAAHMIPSNGLSDDVWHLDGREPIRQPISGPASNMMEERQRVLVYSCECTFLSPESSFPSCCTPLILWLCQPSGVDQPLPWDDHRGNFSISATRPSQVWDTKCHTYTAPYVTSNQSSCYIKPFCHQGE